MPKSAGNSLPLSPALRAYADESRRPLTSLLFVLPLLLVYEAGVLAMGPDAMRNGADVWLRQLLDWFSLQALGRGEYFLLPALIIVGLLAWHHLRGDPWRVSGTALYGMAAECALLAVGLVLLAQFQGQLFAAFAGAPALDAAPLTAIKGQLGAKWFFSEVVRYCGAGIYEEALFRLLMFPLAWTLLRWIGLSPRGQAIGAIVATSLLFAAAHYVGVYGETLEWRTFTFRFLAGALFATLFYLRGFGIAAGTHALYDIYVGLAN